MEGKGAATGIWLEEAKDAAADPTMHKTAPHQVTIWLKMSVVLRWRNPGLELPKINLNSSQQS